MRKAAALLSSLLALVATPALAHPGHLESGFSAGLLHPFTGLDHLLVMAAVGLWAGLALEGKARLLWPLTFVAFMSVGFAFGIGGGPVPGVEGLILASLVAIGAAIGLDLKPPVAVGAALIALFAVAHGYAHGQEAPASGALPFAAGFAISTVILHGAGLSLAALSRRGQARIALRAAGLGVAAAGLAFALV